MPRQLPALILTDEQDEQLKSISQSTSMPHGLVQRARIILACARGQTDSAVAGRLGVSGSVVGKWRRRFVERGVQGLHDELRPGRPRTYDDEKVATLITSALQDKPENANAWSVRRMADAQGVSKSTVQRRFSLFGGRPHRSKTFKLSSDPFFVEKVRDVVGLYLNPPDNAVVPVSTRRARSRLLTGPNRRFRWDWAMSRATLTTISATEPRRCSRPSMWPPARSSARAASVTGIRSFSPSRRSSTARPRPNSTSISSSTTSPPISMSRCAPGWPNDHVFICTSLRPTRHGPSGGALVRPHKPAGYQAGIVQQCLPSGQDD